MKKRIFALLLALCMVFGMTTVALGADGDTAEEAIYLYYSGEAVEVSVDAGKEPYYQSYGVSGTTLTIENADAYVIYNGTTYNAVDGVVKVAVTSENPRMPVVYQIGNNGNATATFSVDFAYPAGHQMNPAALEGYATAEIAEGNAQGYFYTYTAEADGIFTFVVNGAMTTDYQQCGWSYTVNNMTKYAYGSNHTSGDELVAPVEFVKVSTGDVIEIVVNTFDPENPWSNPAGTVDVNGFLATDMEDYDDPSIKYAPGSENNPLLIQGTGFAQKILTGETYYYSVRGVAGNEFTINNSDVQVVYRGTTYSANEDGVIVIEMQNPVDFWTPDTFQIVNNSDNDAEITAEFIIPLGSRDNPEDVTGAMYGDAELEEGDEDGYYYQFVAEETGIVTFYNYGDSDLIVTNNSTYKTVTWTEDKDIDDMYDEYICLAVEEGDLVTVQAVAVVDDSNPNVWVYPASTVEWYAYIDGATETDPIIIYDSTYKVDVFNEDSLYFAPYVKIESVTVKGDHAYIVVGEERKEAVDGVVTYTFEEGYDGVFVIGNTFDGTDSWLTYETYEVEVEWAEGTEYNPAELENGKNTVDVDEYELYYYTWTAPADGKVTFTVDGTKGWLYSIASLADADTTEVHAVDGTNYKPATDEEPVKGTVTPSVTYNVKEGDAYLLLVASYEVSEDGETVDMPAGTITTTVDFVVDYAITEGNNQEVTKGEAGDITIKCDGAYADFLGIKVDGKDVAPEYYEVKEGGTIVILKAAFVNTLTAGDHKVTFVYEYGTVDATLTVNASTNPVDPPVTGDTTNAILWIAVLGLGVVAIAGSVVMRKREF